MKRYEIYIPLIITILLLSCSSFAQDKNQIANDMAVKLQQKVLLSSEQTTKVKDILINYIENQSPATLQTAQKSIELLLDKRQKAKYDIVKNDWWSSVQKESLKVDNK